MIAFKFLRRGAVAPISSFKWPTPAPGARGSWVTASGKLEPCRSGVHACSTLDLSYWLHEELWAIELGGEVLPAPHGLVSERGRLLEQVDEWSRVSARFATACAEHAAAEASVMPEEARRVAERCVSDARLFASMGLPAAAAFCAAAAIARGRPPAAIRETYLEERAWQSSWISKELQLQERYQSV
jgi:hypothetical protein